MFPTSWSYIVEALGGLALFILGMRTMSEGLQKVSGERLRRLLEKGTGNRLAAPLIGSCLASLLQSGSAASVLVVGFVNAGLLSLYQALGVLLGTGIGTTLAIQIIAFRISALALPAITVGVFLSFFSRSRNLAQLGGLLLGVGLVFFGLSILEGASLPLSESAIMAGLHEGLVSVRIAAVLLGALLTFVVQSGSATLGIVIALASAGVLPYDAAIAMVIGEVAGAALIPLIASIGGSQAAKRAVIIYLAINWGAIALGLIFFPLFLRAVELLSPGDLSGILDGGATPAVIQAARPHIARHLANAHTVFTVASLLIFLPMIGFIARSAENLLLTRRSESEPRPRFIDTRVIKTPTIALVQAWNELIRMGSIAGAMHRELVSQFDSFNPKVVAAIRDKELVLDVLHRDMSQFLVALSRETLSRERAVEIPVMLQMVNEIELVGDQTEAVLNYLLRKKEERLRFSASAMDELKRFATKVGEVVSLCERILKGEDEDPSRLKAEVASIEDELQMSHMRRLKSGKCNIVAGLLYGDMIVCFSKISQLGFSIIAQKKGINL